MNEALEKLPVITCKDAFVDALRRFQVIIVTGETGSGKSTALPFFCCEAGFDKKGCIAVTEPRRIAAIGLAARAAELDGSPLGSRIGYVVRNRKRQSSSATVCYMTDGVLVASIPNDPLLTRYSVIMIDEAHERSLNIDFLLGYLRIVIAHRSDLRVIITSATPDTRLYRKSFPDAIELHAGGRRYTVDIRYHPVVELWKGYSIDSFIEGTVRCIAEICAQKSEGAILAFLPTVEDVHETIHRVIHRLRDPSCRVLPLHSRLTHDEQQQVFMPCKDRLIVIATNIAETSLTVPGVRFVVDSGLVRMLRYDPAASLSRMPVEKIAQSSAIQRAGRCGRVADGICIRLYSEADYMSRPQFTAPEIKRANCSSLLLKLLQLDKIQPGRFPFVERPHEAAIADAYRKLHELGALDKNRNLTPLGRAMARLPLDPPVACMLLKARQFGVMAEVLVIAAALSSTEPFASVYGSGVGAIGPLRHPDSDFCTYLNVWAALQHEFDRQKKSRYQVVRHFAETYGLHHSRLQEWIDSHDHLRRICREFIGHDAPAVRREVSYESIHKCLLSGLIGGLAMRKDHLHLTGVDVDNIRIASSSVLARTKHQWLLVFGIAETVHVYGTHAAVIDPKWVEELFGDRCSYRYVDAWYDVASGMVKVREEVFYRSLRLIYNREKECHRVDRLLACRVFVRDALVKEMAGDRFSCILHNRHLRHLIGDAEVKLRQTLYAGDDMLEVLYAEVLDTFGGCATAKELSAMYRLGKIAGRLSFTTSQLSVIPLPPELHEHVDELFIGSYRLTVNWKYTPDTMDDGATVCIPEELAMSLPAYAWEWQLPVLCRKRAKLLVEKLTSEIVALQLDPADVEDVLCSSAVQPDGPWLAAMLATLDTTYSVRPCTEIVPEQFPAFLWLRVVVTDASGAGIESFRSPVKRRRAIGALPFMITDPAVIKECRTATLLPDLLDGERCLAEKWYTSGKQCAPIKCITALHRRSDSFRICLFSHLGSAYTAHAEALLHFAERACAEAMAWESESLRISDTLLHEARAVFAGNIHETAHRLLNKRVFVLPSPLPGSRDEVHTWVSNVKARVHQAADRTVDCIRRMITLFADVNEQLRKKRYRHDSGMYAPVHELFLREYAAYCKAFEDVAGSVAYGDRLEYYVAALPLRLDAALYEPLKFRSNFELPQRCREALAQNPQFADFLLEEKRETLRMNVEEYLAGSVLSPNKRASVPTVAELEACLNEFTKYQKAYQDL